MLIIFLVLIVSQFVSIELFTLFDVVISVEKLSALTLYPLAIYLLGIRNLRLNKELILFAVLMYLSFTLFYLNSGSFSPRLLSSGLIIAINGATALLIYTALHADTHSVQTFFKLWIICAVLSAVICIGQFLHLIPLVDEDTIRTGIVRAEGLLKDPNYQSVLLLIGYGSLLTLHRIRYRYLFIVIIVLGIVSTGSRMGFLGYLILTVGSLFLRKTPQKEGTGKNSISARISVLLVVGGLILLLLLLPTDFRSVFSGRIQTTLTAFQDSISEAAASSLSETVTRSESSAPARFILGRQALIGSFDHLLTGIGLYNTPDYMLETVGMRLEVHNSFLHMLLVGGLTGLLFLLYAGFFILRFVISSFPLKGDETSETILVAIIVFILCGSFLSLVTIVLPWIIFILALYGYEHNRETISK
ncbi:MAG: O-antigen ligase family protein [Spirochaetia bacterium]|nr:O-antigen ligase family protein [Spirochaetia bacterium]MCF7941094.1 O-antigen ligase family protein [Spirochaetia bacterium]